MAGTPPDPAGLLLALGEYQRLFHLHAEGFAAAGALGAAFERLHALQRTRAPALADAFELLEHVHRAALACAPAALGPWRERHDLLVAECAALLRALH